MKLSLIIPVYNEAENLLSCLSFLTEEANKNAIEIIVAISPETTDHSAEICSHFSKVTFFTTSQKGRARQMNEAAKKAIGQVLLFLHADVRLPYDFYDQIQRKIEQGYKAGFFAYRFDKTSKLLDFNARFTAKKGWFSGGGDQSHFFTKILFEKLGGYDEAFCIMEDFELIDRLKKQKIAYSIIQSKATVSARKYHTNSWLQVNLINGSVFLLYKIGIHPKLLRKVYKGLLRESV